jgi:hypothetical protein
MARVGRSVIVSLDNAGHWRARWRALCGEGSGAPLASGEPRVRAITLPQFEEVVARLGLRREERWLLVGERRVRFCPHLLAESAVFRVVKA